MLHHHHTGLERQHQRYQPLDEWLHDEQVSATLLLRAERCGARLPVWFATPARAMVDLQRAYNWRQLVRLMDEAATQLTSTSHPQGPSHRSCRGETGGEA